MATLVTPMHVDPNTQPKSLNKVRLHALTEGIRSDEELTAYFETISKENPDGPLEITVTDKSMIALKDPANPSGEQHHNVARLIQLLQVLTLVFKAPGFARDTYVWIRGCKWVSREEYNACLKHFYPSGDKGPAFGCAEGVTPEDLLQTPGCPQNEYWLHFRPERNGEPAVTRMAFMGGFLSNFTNFIRRFDLVKLLKGSLWERVVEANADVIGESVMVNNPEELIHWPKVLAAQAMIEYGEFDFAKWRKDAESKRDKLVAKNATEKRANKVQENEIEISFLNSALAYSDDEELRKFVCGYALAKFFDKDESNVLVNSPASAKACGNTAFVDKRCFPGLNGKKPASMEPALMGFDSELVANLPSNVVAMAGITALRMEDDPLMRAFFRALYDLEIVLFEAAIHCNGEAPDFAWAMGWCVKYMDNPELLVNLTPCTNVFGRGVTLALLLAFGGNGKVYTEALATEARAALKMEDASMLYKCCLDSSFEFFRRGFGAPADFMEQKVAFGRTLSEGGRTLSEGGRTLSEGGRTLSEGGRTLSEGDHTMSEGGRTLSERPESPSGRTGSDSKKLRTDSA